MAKNLPKHSLEKWAECFTKTSYLTYINENSTAFFFEESVQTLIQQDNIPAPVASSILANCLFARNLLEGTGHIVKIAPELIDDILSSTIDEETIEQFLPHVYLPWEIFAIELNKDEDYQAIIITTDAYIIRHCIQLSEFFGIKRDILVTLQQILVTNNPEFPQKTHAAFGLVPSQELLYKQGQYLAEEFANECEKNQQAPRDKFGRIITGHDNIVETFTPLFTTQVPHDLHRIPTKLPGKTNDVEPATSLVTFICAKNTQIRTIYTPTGNPKNKTKQRKRSKATIHECGFEWTETYREYRKAKSQYKALGGSVRPHTRRGHYHHFWVGPKDGERKLITHWIPPILVKGKLGKPRNTGHIIRN